MKVIEDRINISENNIKKYDEQKQELENETEELKERIKMLEEVNAKDLDKEQIHSLIAIVAILATTILSVGTKINTVNVSNVIETIVTLISAPIAVTAASVCALLADSKSRKLYIKREYDVEGKLFDEIRKEKEQVKSNEQTIEKYTKDIERCKIEIELLKELLKSLGYNSTKKENTNSFQIYNLQNEKKLSRTKTR